MGKFLPDGRNYCRYHRPWINRPIAADDIYDARAMQIMGWPLDQISRELNVSRVDLDVALWRALGRRDVTGLPL